MRYFHSEILPWIVRHKHHGSGRVATAKCLKEEFVRAAVEEPTARAKTGSKSY